MNPTSIVYHSASKTLELGYANGEPVTLPAELLRVYSPSAEVRGHSESERVVQTGKKHVGIKSLEAIGNYAIRIVFDDGHDTGIYSWAYLKDLGDNQARYWTQYETELRAMNGSRLPVIPVGQWTPQ
ncbi:MAG: DUF971 domain-containing protein [Gammaproteobacteria bacterium]|nr:DUF971 domain-containing protein [Gammaproteobacteria bacterium]MXY52083.1 DUF971 domain-containing protein [Gammaproteobacteria bacterium]MYB39235.1 DUF971 domain-containing protein [Gammaproteobacteria bacterium]